MVGPPPSPSSVASVSGVLHSVSVPESNPCGGHWERQGLCLAITTPPPWPSDIHFPTTCKTVAFRPIVTVVVMAKGVGVGGRCGTGFSVSGMRREVCSRNGRSVRSGVRPIKTKEAKEEPGLSLRGIPSSGGRVDRGSFPPSSEAGGGKTGAPYKVARGETSSEEQSRAKFPRPGNRNGLAPGPSGESKKPALRGQTTGSPAPRVFSPDSSAVSQPGCSSSSLDSCRRTGSRQRTW